MAGCEVATASHREADQLAFFRMAAEGFQRAAAAAGIIEKTYRIADSTICLRFAGPGLTSGICPALEHNRTQAALPPDFTIELFDSVSTGTPLPLLLGDAVERIRQYWWERLANRRQIKDYHGKRIKSVFHLGPDILSIFDSEKARAVYWVRDAGSLPYYETGSPLSTLLNWWMGRQGKTYVHAAAFGNADGGVLLTGKGGSGKSTTTLSCLDSELLIVGDDYCVLDAEKRVAHSLYNTVKLKGKADLGRFPDLAPLVSNLDRVGQGEAPEKAMLFLHEHFPDKLAETLPIKALLVPVITGLPETSFGPCSPAAALKSIAPNTLFQLADNAAPTFEALVRLVRSLPLYQIRLGTRMRDIPGEIAHFLEQV